MIKLIVFDIGNVLLKDTGIIRDEIGKKLSEISYQSMYDSNFKTEIEEFCKENHYDKDYLRERLKTYFKDRYKLNMTQQEFQSLACRYKLGIGSNYISDIFNNFESVKDYFSIVLISGAIEVEKPDKKFFQIMIDEASYHGIFPREILFIDDKEENLQAARELNIHTMQYDNEVSGSLYDSINKWIEDFEKEENNLIKSNKEINNTLNNIAKRPSTILKEKLERQNNATYNEMTVGAIPVLDTYEFKPTGETQHNLFDKEYGKDYEKYKELNEEELFFNEETLLSLSRLEVPFSKEDLYPVYILLSYGATTMGKIIKKFTKEPYSHGSIAFDSRLKSLYSFIGSGFTHENITDKKTYGSKDDYKYSLYVLFVNQNQLEVMDKFLDNLCSNINKLSYSLKGCINNFFNKETHDKDKFFCSQFVAQIIKEADNTRVKKDSSLYTPYDLKKIKNVFFVQKGFLKNYNHKKTDERVNKIKEGLINNSLNESFNYLKLKDNGDLILRYTKINYKEEYNKSHKLLKIYKTTGDTNSIKEELAKLWSYYLIIEEIYVQKGRNDSSFKSTQEYKDAIIAKAFILGDIKDYLSFIKTKEPSFDFAKYYEESKYNKDAIIITKKDIKNLVKMIGSLL